MRRDFSLGSFHFFKQYIMLEFVPIFESYYLYEVEIMKTKLASRGIESYVKNEFINNVALMPVNQFYILYVKSEDSETAEKVIKEVDRD